jgi:hypothetical protein
LLLSGVTRPGEIIFNCIEIHEAFGESANKGTFQRLTLQREKKSIKPPVGVRAANLFREGLRPLLLG